MKKIFFFILGIWCLMKDSAAEIVTSTALEEIVSALDNLQEGDLLLVDVDDTLITPVSQVFHDRGRPLHFIDELKAEKDSLENLPEILGTWRLSRAIQLVNTSWPAILQTLRDRGVIVLGLTQMETGPCGPISSLEEWRSKELKNLGFPFTERIDGTASFPLKETAAGKAVFYNGLMMTGPFSKGEVLEIFLTYTKLKPQFIVFFDDKRFHVEDVEKVAIKYQSTYLGVHFREVEKLLSSPDPRVVNLQKETLLKEKKWLEDEKAAIQLKQLKIVSS